MATRGRTQEVADEVEEFEEFEAEDGVEVEDEGEDIEGTGDELDDLELEEVEDEDEVEEVEEAPQKKGRKPAAKKAAAPKKKPVNAVEFGTAELLALIEKEHGKAYDGRQLRVLLRKMKAAGELPGEAADGKRYSFTGPEDPQVQAIIQRVKSGEIDEATQAALEKLKKDAEAKRAAKKAEKEAAEAKAAAEATDEVEEDEVEEEAPKPAPKRRAPAKKATATRRAPARKKATDVAEDDGDDEE